MPPRSHKYYNSEDDLAIQAKHDLRAPTFILIQLQRKSNLLEGTLSKLRFVNVQTLKPQVNYLLKSASLVNTFSHR